MYRVVKNVSVNESVDGSGNKIYVQSNRVLLKAFSMDIKFVTAAN